MRETVFEQTSNALAANGILKRRCHFLRWRVARAEFSAWPGTLLSALILVGGLAATAQAAAPAFSYTNPYGAQRGTELDLLFVGARLTDAQEIIYYYPGITTKSLEVVNDSQVKVHVAIDPNCRPGIHAMRVRTATGISELRTFMVGLLPESSEKEPNNDFAQPQPISLDTTVVGIAENEDVDYFVLEAKAGQSITAEVEGIRLGVTFFDPYVSIMDEGRFELDSCDDSALLWQDAVASLVAPKDGKYIVQVRESSYAGNASCVYRLHVGRFPRPTAVLPAGAKLGTKTDVRFIGSVGGELIQSVQIDALARDFSGLFATDAQGQAPSPNIFRLGNLENVLETEPNDQVAAATAGAAPAALNGVISKPGDVDYFKFAAKQGQAFDVRLLARSLRSPLDAVCYVFGPDGGTIAGNDDSGGPDSYIRFSAPSDGDYHVSVADHLGNGDSDYVYRIEVSPVAPTLTLGLPERQQYVDVTTSVPRGNRMALLVSAARADFGGDLAIDVRDLPAGVSVETVPMAANQSIVPVVFTAAGDAPTAAALADIVGRTTDPNLAIEGHLSQTTGLVRGQNQILVWGHTADRMALAVTQDAPFAIQITEPKVPLVRDGTLGLKVVATRQNGFTAPIAIRMLYDPPGVGSSGSIVIPEGQTEAVIPLTANSGAEAREWRIVVLGEATVGDGPILVSSPFAKLTVSEPFFSFAFQSAAVERAKETEVVVKVTKNKDYEGPSTVELLGLPHQVTAEPVQMTKETTELVFKVKTGGESPVGKHPTLLCRAVVTADGDPITHVLGTGELRIDEPLPPKANEAPMPEQTAAAPAVEEKPPEKRLTRLEQLRLDRKKSKEKSSGGQPAPGH